MDFEKKIKRAKEIEKIAKKLHRQKKKIITTNGCFDILHYGHLKYLYNAKNYGDILIVAINSDSSVRINKGKGRPVNNQRFRSVMIAALEFVDYVVLFKEKTPVKILCRIKPDFHIKGGDYKMSQIVEKKAVESVGGKVVILKFVKGFSSTKIIKKLGIT